MTKTSVDEKMNNSGTLKFIKINKKGKVDRYDDVSQRSMIYHIQNPHTRC